MPRLLRPHILATLNDGVPEDSVKEMVEAITDACADTVWQTRLLKGCRKVLDDPTRAKIYQGKTPANLPRSREAKVGQFRILYNFDATGVWFEGIGWRDKVFGRGFKH